ncbi:hypothetical protein EDD79_100587 [Serpentinicella alkaliphila]|uniref:Uncharacterized protein n=1 Tax=Serpentinicella alkaliphila TaxID=1734049 RepID=A0A4R2TNB9_9FIRM|nr:hypothetical protein EDD79_100587 [Serpentinicella alkaliphila]
MRAFGSPEDIGRVVMYVVSKAANFVNSYIFNC